MKAREVMTSDPRSCGPDDTLERAADIMWQGDCGCVPVVDAERCVVGLVTDRDVCMAAYTRGQPLWAIPVSTAMAHEVFTMGPDDTLTMAGEVMRAKRVRRLPVVDAEGRLVGIVTLNDLARVAANYRGGTHPKDLEVIGTTLAEISRPRTPPAQARPMPQPTVASPPPS